MIIAVVDATPRLARTCPHLHPHRSSLLRSSSFKSSTNHVFGLNRSSKPHMSLPCTRNFESFHTLGSTQAIRDNMIWEWKEWTNHDGCGRNVDAELAAIFEWSKVLSHLAISLGSASVPSRSSARPPEHQRQFSSSSCRFFVLPTGDS